MPGHPEVHLQQLKAATFSMDSDLPYTIQLISYRFPGSASPDYAASRILVDVLSSQRAALYDLVTQGKALFAGFQTGETYPLGAAAFALAAVPPNAPTDAITADLRRILNDYVKNGVPADLVEAAQKSELASAEFQRNSISELASLWSQSLAAEGRESPDEDLEAIKKVTVADVNRVAKQYLSAPSIVGTLKPAPTGKAVSSKGFGGAETTTSTPTKPVALPEWAEAAVKSLRIPAQSAKPSDVTLANGIRLIVRTEKTSPTITLSGSIKTLDELETPPGKDGVSDILGGLFSYGTKSLDRAGVSEGAGRYCSV